MGTADQPAPTPMTALDDYDLASLALCAFEGVTQPRITRTKWKDGIDLEVATAGLRRFADAVVERELSAAKAEVERNARWRGLIWGAALVALHGLESELQSLCFARGYKSDADLDEVRRVRKAYENREQVVTSHRWILDRMAHTAQTIRVSRDEWDSIVNIRSGRVQIEKEKNANETPSL